MTAPLLAEACEWARGLRLDQVPEDVRRLGLAQIDSALGAMGSGLAHPVGARIRAAAATRPGWSGAPARSNAGEAGWIEAAATAATASMALDYDETLFAGHTGHSCALVPLACAGLLQLGGSSWPSHPEPGGGREDPAVEAQELGRRQAERDRALLASIAATEVAARITAALTLGRARGQTAAHTHLAGTAIAAGLMLGLDAERLLDALTLALAQPVRVLYPAFMGSDAKLAVAAGPIRLAGTAVLAAAAGMRGPRDVLERPGGLLEELAEVPLPEALGGLPQAAAGAETAALGERWHLRTLSVKAVPGCAYLSAAVDAAIELAAAGIEAGAVEEVVVEASIFTLRMEAEAAPFVRGPQSPLAALNFSAGYSVATALLTGDLRAEDFWGAPLRRQERWELAGRVRLAHDPGLTLRALSATAPVGAALAWAGGRGRAYLARGGAGEELADQVLAACARRAPEHFVRPSKEVGARVRVRLRDGRELAAERLSARGACGESVESRAALASGKRRRRPGSAAPG